MVDVFRVNASNDTCLHRLCTSLNKDITTNGDVLFLLFKYHIFKHHYDILSYYSNKTNKIIKIII